MSRYDQYSSSALKILVEAQKIVRQQNRNVCEVDDLLAGLLLSDVDATRFFLDKNKLAPNKQWLDIIQSRTNEAKAEAHESGSDNTPASKILLGEKVRSILDRAEEIASNNGVVHSEHLFHAAWPEIKETIQSCLTHTQLGNPPDPKTFKLPPLRAFPRPQTGGSDDIPQKVPLNVLIEFGQELTARENPFPIIGRDEIIQDMAGILMKCFKPNPIIIGDAGVGKTAIVEGLAGQIKKGTVPHQLQGTRIFEIRISDLVAGTKMHGSFEERMRQLIKEIETNPDVILFLDEIHLLVQEGKSNNLADILKPALARGLFRCIGATTTAEYHRYIQKDAALARRFQVIHVDEPDLESTYLILKGLQPVLENHYGLNITDDVLESTIKLGKEFLVNRRFPDKAVDILDRSCTRVVSEHGDRLSVDDIRKTVSRIIGIGNLEDTENYKSRLAALENMLCDYIIGQDRAVNAVANTVRLCKKRLDLRPERPDGVFLFTGPSGVGKTALGEALAEILTGSKSHFIRLDMSEYSESHAVSRLIGSPTGYVGYGDPPPLIQGLRRSPSGVLLLDEFEKAHPDVHRMFLQVFDSGRLTDAMAETYSLANITIIATANIFAKPKKSLGFTKEEESESSLNAAQMRLVKQFFPTELINRFDEIVVFNALSRDMAKEILARRILPVGLDNLQSIMGIALQLSPAAEALVLDKGYSEEFGVRNLHRTFEALILKPLAVYLERHAVEKHKTTGEKLVADLGPEKGITFSYLPL